MRSWSGLIFMVSVSVAGGPVPNAGHQRGLGHAHHVVVGHGALGTQVGEGQQAAVTALHHFATGLGQCHETVGADVVGNLETFTGSDFGKVAIELIAWGEADRVDDAVQAIPLLAQLLEHLGNIRVVGDVAREAHLGAGAPAGGELLDATLELVVLISERQFSAFTVHGGGDARGNRQFAGNADDQYALTGEKTHVLVPLLVVRQRRAP